MQLAQPFQWIAQGKIGVGDFLAGALSPGFKPTGIGVAAMYDHAGYDRDGAYDYGGIPARAGSRTATAASSAR